MICWIGYTQKILIFYKQLCFSEGAQPQIMEQREDVTHVCMTANTASTWNMAVTGIRWVKL